LNYQNLIGIFLNKENQMYNRRKYKDFALKQLKGRWGVPVVMSIITGLIMLIFNAPEYIKMMKTEAFHTLWNADFMTFGEMFTAINEMTDSASSTLKLTSYATRSPPELDSNSTCCILCRNIMSVSF